MFNKVLIVHSNLGEAEPLLDYFNQLNARVWPTTTPAEATNILDTVQPELLIVDLHLPGNAWLELLRHTRQTQPTTKIIITNQRPDVKREFQAKEHASVFLRAPFNLEWIQAALQKLTAEAGDIPTAVKSGVSLPEVRWPIRLKITGPYVALAGVFMVVAFSLMAGYFFRSMDERLTNQLVNASGAASNAMIRQEDHALATLRLLANIEGMEQVLATRDLDRLTTFATLLTVNNQEDAIDILDLAGVSLVSLRRRPGGAADDYDVTSGTPFGQWPFVQKVLNRVEDGTGDKYGGLVRNGRGDYFYVAGPIMNDDNTQMVGVILIGRLVTTLLQDFQQDANTIVTLYNREGEILNSTSTAWGSQTISTEYLQPLLDNRASQLIRPDLTINGVRYNEAINVWEVRGGEKIGLIGIAAQQNYFASPDLSLQAQVLLAVTLGLGATIGLGIFVAGRFTRPLNQVVNAAIQVADGELDVKLEPEGDDEVAVLGHAFNYMLIGLQERNMYHDILGRTVSPQVREALRLSFASGSLRLEGQNVQATVLMSDIRNFTTLSEKESPPTVMRWLNEYFTELVPAIINNGGVVDKFEGDAILAFFGILPNPLPPAESAYQACKAAADMLKIVEALNARRVARNDPPLVTGIGVNTGLVTAGGLGAADRLNYTIIGDTVNTAQRLESFTRQFGENGAVISEDVREALAGRRNEFTLEPLGAHLFKGKTQTLAIYRLRAHSHV